MVDTCICDGIQYDSCPPYASVKDMKTFFDNTCINCSGTVATNIENGSILSSLNLDPCCQKIFVIRGNQLIVSFDGGTTWLEVGTAQAIYNSTFGSTGFTVNVNNDLAMTGGNTTEASDTIFASIASNGIQLAKAGMYTVEMLIRLTYSTAAALNINYELLVNGAIVSPRVVTTMHYNGANPTADTNARWARLGITRRFATNDVLRLRVLSGATITSNPFNVSTVITKLSS